MASLVRSSVTAGQRPNTRKQVYLRATIDGADDKAWRKAEDKLAEFRTQVIKRRNASASVTLSYALDEWMRVGELEDISGALGAAVRWEWITSNPARVARQPKRKPPEPDPPDAIAVVLDEWDSGGAVDWLKRNNADPADIELWRRRIVDAA